MPWVQGYTSNNSTATTESIFTNCNNLSALVFGTTRINNTNSLKDLKSLKYLYLTKLPVANATSDVLPTNKQLDELVVPADQLSAYQANSMWINTAKVIRAPTDNEADYNNFFWPVEEDNTEIAKCRPNKISTSPFYTKKWE